MKILDFEEERGGVCVQTARGSAPSAKVPTNLIADVEIAALMGHWVLCPGGVGVGTGSRHVCHKL